MKVIFSQGREIKAFLLLFSILFINTILNAQEGIECATPDPTGPLPVLNYPENIDAAYFENLGTVVLNVFFWGINEDDGSSTNKLNQTDALHAIAQLNKKYNQFNVFFKYFGYGYINSSRFYTIYKDCQDPDDVDSDSCLYGDFPEFLYYNPQYINDEAINVYVPYSTDGFAGYGLDIETRIVINSISFENDNPLVINHEMGHVLGLHHTHLGWQNPVYSEDFDCEHVTRDTTLECDYENNPLQSCYNATSKGDQLHDTNAVPDFQNEFCVELGLTPCPQELHFNYITDSPSCQYNNEDGRDCQNTPYEILTEDVRNLMAYTYSECGKDLTLDQGAYLRAKIENNPNRYNPVKNELGVEALYQPYKGQYSLDGRTVGPDIPPTFQPGFDYEFVSCGPYGEYPPPPDYYDTSFWYINGGLFNYTFSKDIPREHYGNIIHKNNFAIIIAQVQNLYPARNCYSVSGASKSGSVTRFNDNVFNTNITITPKDSLEINNPNLINNLQQGLYKIEKVYLDGTIEEVVILKQQQP